MRHLLDVNALIALLWADHADHAKVMSWRKGKELAVCPLSELGFLRVSTNPKALGRTMDAARKLLESFYADEDVLHVDADLQALESHAKQHSEVTDQYLAALAGKHGIRLATLDAGINHKDVELIA